MRSHFYNRLPNFLLNWRKNNLLAFNVDRKAEAPVLFNLLLTHQKTRMVVVLRITYTVIKADRRVIGTFNRVKSALSCIHKAQPGVSRIIEMLVISYLVFVPIRIVPALGGEHNTNSVCTHLSSPSERWAWLMWPISILKTCL